MTLFGQESEEALACCHTWRMLLEEKGALIFAGPPGCGKTYAAERLAEAIAGSGNWELITFSPAYSYEEFVAGWRPVGDTFKSVDGPLLRLARDAKREEPRVLIIDEVNRANLAQVMGECYTLLEDRGEGVLLRSSRERRSLPPNLYIIATMNTADKSISSLDVALRRRFATVQFDATLSPFNLVLRNGLESANLRQHVKHIQDFLDKVHSSADDGLGSGGRPLLGPDAQIGASYFCAAAETAQATGSPFSQVISTTWHTEILPYVRDVLMNNSEAIREVAQEWRECLTAIKRADDGMGGAMPPPAGPRHLPDAGGRPARFRARGPLRRRAARLRLQAGRPRARLLLGPRARARSRAPPAHVRQRGRLVQAEPLHDSVRGREVGLEASFSFLCEELDEKKTKRRRTTFFVFLGCRGVKGVDRELRKSGDATHFATDGPAPRR